MSKPAAFTIQFDNLPSAVTIARLRDLEYDLPVDPAWGSHMIEIEIEERGGNSGLRAHIPWDAWISALKDLIASGTIPLETIVARDLESSPGRAAEEFGVRQAQLAIQRGIKDQHTIDTTQTHSQLGFYCGYFMGAAAARKEQ